MVATSEIENMQRCKKHSIYFLHKFSLRNRQNEWKREEAERIANTPDPTIPQGHVLMADADRRETLEILKKCRLYAWYI